MSERLVIAAAGGVPGLYNVREPDGTVHMDLTVNQVKDLAGRLGFQLEDYVVAGRINA